MSRYGLLLLEATFVAPIPFLLFFGRQPTSMTLTTYLIFLIVGSTIIFVLKKT